MKSQELQQKYDTYRERERESMWQRIEIETKKIRKTRIKSSFNLFLYLRIYKPNKHDINKKQ